MATFEELEAEALQLTERERLRLAASLLKSCPPPGDDIEDEDPEQVVETAWNTELHRRADEIRSGAVQGVPGKEAVARIKAKLKQMD